MFSAGSVLWQGRSNKESLYYHRQRCACICALVQCDRLLGPVHKLCHHITNITHRPEDMQRAGHRAIVSVDLSHHQVHAISHGITHTAKTKTMPGKRWKLSTVNHGEAKQLSWKLQSQGTSSSNHCSSCSSIMLYCNYCGQMPICCYREKDRNRRPANAQGEDDDEEEERPKKPAFTRPERPRSDDGTGKREWTWQKKSREYTASVLV